jgi:hypothetical protein
MPLSPFSAVATQYPSAPQGIRENDTHLRIVVDNQHTPLLMPDHVFVLHGAAEHIGAINAVPRPKMLVRPVPFSAGLLRPDSPSVMGPDLVGVHS